MSCLDKNSDPLEEVRKTIPKLFPTTLNNKQGATKEKEYLKSNYLALSLDLFDDSIDELLNKINYGRNVNSELEVMVVHKNKETILCTLIDLIEYLSKLPNECHLEDMSIDWLGQPNQILYDIEEGRYPKFPWPKDLAITLILENTVEVYKKLREKR